MILRRKKKAEKGDPSKRGEGIQELKLIAEGRKGHWTNLDPTIKQRRENRRLHRRQKIFGGGFFKPRLKRALANESKKTFLGKGDANSAICLVRAVDDRRKGEEKKLRSLSTEGEGKGNEEED